VAAELVRARDVGMVDLHRRLPGPLTISGQIVIGDHCRSIVFEYGRARIPSPTLALMSLVAHDQFHDSDYWRARIDLRHLIDIAKLTRQPPGLDRDLLFRLAGRGLLRTALDVNLIAAEKLAGACVTGWRHRRAWPWLQYQRRLLLLTYPELNRVLLGLSIFVEWPDLIAYFLRNQAVRRTLRGGSMNVQHSVTNAVTRLRGVPWSRATPPGKV
jgi:hypothetical protein